MKKTLSAALSTSLILGFAGTALAVHGEIPAETSTVVAKKGVMIGIDGSYLAQDVGPVYSPYDRNVVLEIPSEESKS